MINMKATSMTKKTVTTIITVDLGYNNAEEKNAIMHFCQEIYNACKDKEIMGQVITNIALGHPHSRSTEDNYEIIIK